jgi:hypothetical protein
MSEYNAERQAERAKTARLKELRLPKRIRARNEQRDCGRSFRCGQPHRDSGRGADCPRLLTETVTAESEAH